MDRVDLMLLLEGTGELFVIARSALAEGAEFKVWPEQVPTQHLLGIYARRGRAVARAGQPSLGFAEALESLSAFAGNEAVLGFIDNRPQGGYYIQLFLKPDLSGVICCLAVMPSEGDEPGEDEPGASRG